MEFHKYTISKKGFFRKSFEILEDNKLKYKVSTPGWFGYRHLIFNDTDDRDVLVIKRNLSLFKRNFELVASGDLKAELTTSLLGKKHTLKTDVAIYVAESNWLGDEYTIYLGDDDIAKVSRKFFSNDQQYGIAIMGGNHDLFILGMIVCIEVQRMTRNKG